MDQPQYTRQHSVSTTASASLDNSSQSDELHFAGMPQASSSAYSQQQQSPHHHQLSSSSSSSSQNQYMTSPQANSYQFPQSPPQQLLQHHHSLHQPHQSQSQPYPLHRQLSSNQTQQPQHSSTNSTSLLATSTQPLPSSQHRQPYYPQQQQQQQHQTSTKVPNILQPAGGLAPRGSVPQSPNNQSSHSSTAPTLPLLEMQMSPQQSEYRSRPPAPLTTASSSSAGGGHSYSLSRGSPATGGGGAFPESSYQPYTPTTPSGAGHGNFASSPIGGTTGSGGTQRMPNAPLGLADIRPRADSSISDGAPGSLAYDLAHQNPGTSNYLAPWTAYAFDWCKWAPRGNDAGKLALASYLEDGHNFIHILDSQVVPTPQDAYVPGSSKWSLGFTKVAEATHSYPVTRLLWEPQSSQKQDTDLLATSGDHLRLWSLPSDAKASLSSSPQGNSITSRDRASRPTTKLTPLALLSNSKTPEHTAPLTSLDWNTVSPSLIITSSIDTTCTIWDIPSLTAKTQLIAHDKEVYDVRFCANSIDVFVSCGQDGSVRMFDLRSLEHSTIIYEPNQKEDRDARMSPTLAQQTMTTPQPLLRIATSPHDNNLLSTFAMDSNVVRLLDVRQPGQALFELRGHGGAVNCVEWSPTRRGMLASGGDDCQVLVWDLLNQTTQMVNGSGQTEPHRNPVLSWQCDYEVNNVAWVPQLGGAGGGGGSGGGGDYGEWLGVGAGRGIWGVRVR